MISVAVREWFMAWFVVLALGVALLVVAMIMPLVAIVKMVDLLLSWRGWRS